MASDIQKQAIIKNLQNLKILNKRILNKIEEIKKREDLKEYHQLLKKNYKKIIRYAEIAKSKKVKNILTLEHMLSNVDNTKDIQKFINHIVFESAKSKEKIKTNNIVLYVAE